jgi:ankyrin repeat protein
MALLSGELAPDQMCAVCPLAALSVMVMLGASAGPVPDPPVADAAMRGDRDAVRALLRQGADANAAQADGMTALHWAAQKGDVEMARILIYAGASVRCSITAPKLTRARPAWGQTALMTFTDSPRRGEPGR